jgi:hypothetical protein
MKKKMLYSIVVLVILAVAIAGWYYFSSVGRWWEPLCPQWLCQDIKTYTCPTGTTSYSCSNNLLCNIPTVFDFNIQILPSIDTVKQSQYREPWVMVNLLGGSPLKVTLNIDNCPSGLNCYLWGSSPHEILPPGSNIMTVQTFTNTTPGYYTINVSGTIGNIIRRGTYKLKVLPYTAPDFSLSSSLTGITINRGETANIPIKVTSINNYSGTVSFSTESGCPKGATCTYNPISVYLPQGSTVSTTLKIATTSTTPLSDNYLVRPMATDGSITHVYKYIILTVGPLYNVKSYTITLNATANRSSDGKTVAIFYPISDEPKTFNTSASLAQGETSTLPDSIIFGLKSLTISPGWAYSRINLTSDVDYTESDFALQQTKTISLKVPLPIVCGDNTKGKTEQCDGNDDSLCPGKCKADCTCANFEEKSYSCPSGYTPSCLGSTLKCTGTANYICMVQQPYPYCTQYGSCDVCIE